MDRVISYDGALVQTTDLLNTNKFSLIGQAFQNLAILGASTVVSGLACTPTSPTPNLFVNIAIGSIYALDPTDATAYGDLGVDNNVVMKQGILHTPLSLQIVPPSTAGQSQVYLVQANLNDADGGAGVLSYFNAANNQAPFAGPAGSGISQFTLRQTFCNVALKAGLAATTGTQVAPSPDAGFVGLYAITVANGATQVTSGNIVQLLTAPFFPTLPQVPGQVQAGTYVYAGQDTGTANNYVIAFAAGQPVPTAYVAGMGIKFKALNACSGASVVNVNGLGNVTIKRGSTAGVTTGDIVSGQIVELTYDGTNFQMQNYLGSGTNTNTNTQVGIPYIADSGAQNALVGTYSPAITSGQQVAGLTLAIKLANTITGACTINVSGLGTKAVTLGDGNNPPFNAFVAGEVLILEYDGTKYQIANTSLGMFAQRPTANYTIFVNTSTGNDSTQDGTSATVGTGTSGPFKTIGRAITAAWNYLPSQFTITIQVAAGTYNEAVATPLQAGPNVIINGAGSTSTFVSAGAGNTFVCQGPNTLTVQNIAGTNSGGQNNWVFGAQYGGNLTTSNTASAAVNGNVFFAGNVGIVAPGNHTFNGSAYSFWGTSYGGNIVMPNATYTFATSVSTTVATVLSASNGIVVVNNTNPPTFVNPGFVSGVRYNAQTQGIIATTGLGINFFPGTVSGTAAGGTYT